MTFMVDIIDAEGKTSRLTYVALEDQIAKAEAESGPMEASFMKWAKDYFKVVDAS